jgi:hypothetical protein
MRTATHYAEIAVILVAVATAVHYLAGVDWPWAVVAGAAAATLARGLIHRRTPARL